MFTSSEQFRRRRGLVLMILGLLMVPIANVAMAGQETAASIVGQVRDESGGILPGVTVTATSPALQVQSVVSVTDERGEYRLRPLPIGVYSVEYVLPGFGTIKNDEIRLTTGFVAKLDVVMGVGTLSESITVSGLAPVVDVTSTVTTTVLTKELLDLVPTSGYGYVSLVSEAPGARTSTLDVGGSGIEPGGGGSFSFRVFGQTAESWQTIEGILTESGKNSQGGNALDNSSVEEATVETVGANANMRSPGIALNTFVKSGSNQFHGASYFTGTNHQLESNNLDAPLAARGLAGHKTIARYTVGTDLGGPIIKDKLWFYGGTSFRYTEFELLNVFQADGSVASNFRKQMFGTAKLSYQPNAQNRFIFFMQPTYYAGYVSVLTRFLPWEARTMQTCLGARCLAGNPKKVEYQSVRSSVAMSVQYGHWYWNSYKYCEDLKSTTLDLFTQINTGCDFSRHGNQQHEFNHHASANASWYKPDLFAGNHEFKVGADYVANTIADLRISRGDVLKSYQLVFNNGVPFELNTQNTPLDTANPTRYLGIYAQDKWVVGRRLTLALGVRYAHDNGFVPEQCREAAEFAAAECFPAIQFKIWNVFVPRIQAAFDLTGDGKTVVKGGWGRFAHERRADPEVISANRMVATNTTWFWHDNNNNRQYEPGEVNLNPNGPDFVGISALGSTASGTAFSIANPNEKEPMQDQFSGSFERELMPNFGVRLTAMYARKFNNYRTQNNFRPYSSYTIPVTRPDPGPDGRIGTADDTGQSFTYFEYPASLQGAQYVQGMLINPPGMDETYRSFELAGSKRLSRRWTLMVSYSATKKHVPAAGAGGQADYNPNSEVNTEEIGWEWIGRASGAYFLPAGLVLSANYQNLSGTPYARTVLFTGGRTIPSIVLNVEPIGTRRNKTINLLDFRAEKRFQLPGRRQMSVRANVYNALNTNTATGVTNRSGAAFELPTAFINGRILDLGGTFTF